VAAKRQAAKKREQARKDALRRRREVLDALLKVLRAGT
jgi:hypothetical protein